MSTYRIVASPPPKNPRVSTGTVYVTSYDTSTSDRGPRNSTTTVPDHQNVTYQALPIRKSTCPDGKTSKTEYAIRPRQSSAIGNDIKRPLTVSTTNSSPPRRGSTQVASPREVGPRSARDTSNRYLQPSVISPHHSTAQHHRHSSSSRAELDDYSERDRRDRVHTTHGNSGHRAHKSYHSSQSHKPRHQDEGGWSYTGPREQFDRDYPQEPARRRDGQARRERLIDEREFNRVYPKRDHWPSTSTRQPEKTDRSASPRHASRAGIDSDSDRYNEQPPRRESLRAPVLHQHNLRRDDGYSSAREDRDHRSHRHGRVEEHDDAPRRRERDVCAGRERDYGRDRDREYRYDYDRGSDCEKNRDSGRSERPLESRHKTRSLDPSPERSDSKKLAVAALGGLATAGSVGAMHRDTRDQDTEPDWSEDDGDRRRRRRRRRRTNDMAHKSEDPNEQNLPDAPRRRRHEGSGSDTPEDQAPRRSYSHGRRKENERNLEAQSDDRDDPQARRSHRRDTSSSPEDRYQHGHAQPIQGDGEQRAYSQVSSDRGISSHELVLANDDDEQPGDMATRTMSPGENEDERPRRVQLVEPVKDNQEPKPKGILKPARQVPFPEDPNPIREGVAPLKDAAKDGVPVNARWTKINRVLVNPEALEKYHERFEEREDYVIVLRVLSREEIQKLAEKTKEIRETREREWQRKLENRTHEGLQSKPRHADYNDDGEDRRPQLAIENGPTGQSLDALNLQQRPQPQQAQATAQADRARGPTASGSLANDDDFSRNYSQNV